MNLMRGFGNMLEFVVLVALAVASIAAPAGGQLHVLTTSVSGQPLPIREGPMGTPSTSPGDPYWFQQGAISDQKTYNSVGARVSIRTVYDKVNNDAHSYWVGSTLANGAFVQVGYYNGLTTTNQYYCCAWFYEYFPPRNDTSPPIIGPAGSAGPIGSWHTYSMNYNSSFGVWSFYMDNQYLGSSPTAGQQYYLGSGSGVASTGSHSVAALSEVAQTTVSTDVIGPAEFQNLQYETTPNSWNPVTVGLVHVGYGGPQQANPPNPYSVAEIVGVQNDFLTGSNVPYPGPAQPGVDECGNPASNNANLWSVLCLGGTSTNSFSFVDENETSITPTWISLEDSTGRRIFYTDYLNYNGLTVPNPTGQWTMSQVSWRAVDVAAGQTVNMSMPSQVFSTHVFSITLAVVGYFYSLPVKNTTVIMYLPDSTNETLKTDNNGQGVFIQLPAAIYTFHITVPYGISSTTTQTITSPGSIIAKVFGLPELITLVLPPILIAIVVAIAVARKERQRQAMIRSQVIPSPVFGSSFCRSCGQPLSPGANFCTSCGTPRIMTQ